MIKSFPAFDRDQIDAINKLALEIIKSNNIDTNIGINKTFANSASIMDLCEKYPNKKFIALFLDTVESIIKPNFLPTPIYNNLIHKIYNEVIVSKISSYMPINIEESLIEQGIASSFTFFEFPTIKIERYQKVNHFSSNTEINLIYAGSLEKNITNPDLFLM